jgi:hypothetical protein
MPLRPPAGFIRPGFDPLKNPDAPTAVSATGGNESASVAFTPPANVGGSAISQYQAVAYTGGNIVGNTTGTASPINVTGLTNGTAYTFQVWALNTYGPGPFSAMSGGAVPAVPRALFAGGQDNSNFINTIDYITISTTGDAVDFGDLNAAYDCAGASSSTRGLFARSGSTSSIVYVTIATTGNSTDFGILTQARFDVSGCSNETRAIWSGGVDPSSSNIAYNTIDYVTIATTGNALDFGDLTQARRGTAAFSSPTRGVNAGGVLGNSPQTNVVDYVTIASTGNATDFGDLLAATGYAAGCSSSTRGLAAGGIVSDAVNVIQYFTIATTGNATDFGDLSSAVYSASGASSSTRGLFAGGFKTSIFGRINVIEYVTIATTGNATDFGDLNGVRSNAAACSNAHGGL